MAPSSKSLNAKILLLFSSRLCSRVYRLQITKVYTAHLEESDMEDRQQYAESDPRHHAIKIRNMLAEVRDHLREDVRARGGVGLAVGSENTGLRVAKSPCSGKS